MNLTAEKSGQTERPRNGGNLLIRWQWPLIFLSAFLPIVGTIILKSVFGDGHWKHPLFHTALEVSGSAFAILIGLLILIQTRYREDSPHFLWVSLALLCMGIIDFFHGLVDVSPAFYWSRTLATLFGGLLFACIWLPDRLMTKQVFKIAPWLVAISSTGLGLFFLFDPNGLPLMFAPGGVYSLGAKTINLTGGIAFLLAAANFYLRFRKTKTSDDFLFFLLCLLSGAAGVLFALSSMWNAVWWFFHVLRFGSYGILIHYLFKSYQKAEADAHAAFVDRQVSASVKQSEERFKGIFLNSAAGMVVSNEEGKFQAVNPAFCRLLGYSPEELIGRSFLDVTAKEDRAANLQLVHSLPASGQWGDVFEKRYLRKDGTEIWAEVTLSVVRIDGKSSGFIAVVNDITERKRAREELQFQHRLVKTITDNAASCLFMMDKTGRPTFMNPAACRVTGYASLEEIKEKPLHYAVHWKKPDGSYYPMEECPIDNAQAKLVALQEQEEIFCRKDGTLFNVSYSIAPLERDGETVGSVLEFRDITEKKRADDEYRAITELAPQFVWSSDPSGAITYSNKTLLEYMGVEQVALVGDKWIERLHPDEQEVVLRAWKDCVSTGKPYEIEFRIRDKDGRYGWFLNRAVPIRNFATQAIERWLGISVEITQRKLAEEELKRTSSILNAIMTSSDDVIYVKDRFSRMVYCNPTTLRLLGTSEEVLYGKNDVEFLGLGNGGEQILETDKRIMESGKGEVFEEAVTFYDGIPRTYMSQKVPHRDSNGQIIGLIGISRDITELKKAQTHLEDAIRARDEFLSIASHELKTPLTSLKLQTQLHMRAIQKNDPTAYSKERVDAAIAVTDKQVNRLTRLVDDMLDVARIRSGRLNLEFEPVDMCDLVEEVVERLANQFSSAAVPVPKIVRCENARGEWDRLRLEQVITNLLTNAIRYGKGQPIDVEVRASQGRVRISVRDRGVGVAEDAKERIFDRFERAISANEVSGLGLGLFISRQIVLAHKGRIWVESELGEGSTFIVEIPIMPNEIDTKGLETR